VKREAIKAYLASLTAEQFGTVTGSSIVAALAEQGVTVGEREARRGLEAWRFEQWKANQERERKARRKRKPRKS